MQKRNLQHWTFIALGATTLTLAVSRCGPLAPSIDKHGLRSAPSVLTQGGGSRSNADAEQKKLVDSPSFVPLATPSKASASPSPSASPSAFSASPDSITEGLLSAEQIQALKLGQSIEIIIPDEAGYLNFHATFEMNQSRTELQALDLSAIDLVLIRQEENKWIASISSNDADALKIFQKYVVKATYSSYFDISLKKQTSPAPEANSPDSGEGDAK